MLFFVVAKGSVRLGGAVHAWMHFALFPEVRSVRAVLAFTQQLLVIGVSAAALSMKRHGHRWGCAFASFDDLKIAGSHRFGEVCCTDNVANSFFWFFILDSIQMGML
jgi:hypothetical protein